MLPVRQLDDAQDDEVGAEHAAQAAENGADEMDEVVGLDAVLDHAAHDTEDQPQQGVPEGGLVLGGLGDAQDGQDESDDGQDPGHQAEAAGTQSEAAHRGLRALDLTDARGDPHGDHGDEHQDAGDQGQDLRGEDLADAFVRVGKLHFVSLLFFAIRREPEPPL